MREAAHVHDERMRAGGAVMGMAGAPVQVRNHGAAGVQTTRRSFLQAGLPVAGFALIVEVWPLLTTP